MCNYITIDADEFQRLNDFDANLGENLTPTRHDTYSKALKAEMEARNIMRLEDRIRAGGQFRIAGIIMARGDCAPDRPGTVRSPGTRRMSHIKRKWAIFSGK